MATKNSKIANAKAKAAKLTQGKKTTKKSTTKKDSAKKSYVSRGQQAPQSKAYREVNDETLEAKRVGVRWTNEGAKKVGTTTSSKPSGADIEKYGNKTFKVPRKPNPMSEDGSYRYLYSERRADKSDYNRKARLESGGELFDATMFKRGGQTQGQYARANDGRMSRESDGQRMAKPVGWRYRGNNYNTPSDRVIEREMKKSPDDRIIYFEQRRDKSDKNPSKNYISLKRGGQTQGQYARANDGRMSRESDGQRMAKPVGWRYRGNNYNTPSDRVIAREMKKSPDDRIIYFEQRRDKSDKNPSKQYISLRSGGYYK